MLNFLKIFINLYNNRRLSMVSLRICFFCARNVHFISYFDWLNLLNLLTHSTIFWLMQINCDFDISHDIQAFWNSFVISFFKNAFFLYMISKILLIILIGPDVRNLVQIFYLIKFVHTFVHYFVLYSFEEFQGTETSSSFAYQFGWCENFKKSAPL